MNHSVYFPQSLRFKGLDTTGSCLGHSSRRQSKNKPRGHELQSQGVQEEVLIFAVVAYLNGLEVEGARIGEQHLNPKLKLHGKQGVAF